MGGNALRQMATAAGLTSTSLSFNYGFIENDTDREQWQALVKSAMCSDLDFASASTVKFSQMINNSNSSCQGPDTTNSGTPVMTVSYTCP